MPNGFVPETGQLVGTVLSGQEQGLEGQKKSVGRGLLGLVAPILQAVAFGVDPQAFTAGRSFALEAEDRRIAEENRQREIQQQRVKEQREAELFPLQKRALTLGIESAEDKLSVDKALNKVERLRLSLLLEDLPDQFRTEQSNRIIQNIATVANAGELVASADSEEAAITKENELETASPKDFFFSLPKPGDEEGFNVFRFRQGFRFPKEAKSIKVFDVDVPLAGRTIEEMVPIFNAKVREEANELRVELSNTRAAAAIERALIAAEARGNQDVIKQLQQLRQQANNLTTNSRQAGQFYAKLLRAEGLKEGPIAQAMQAITGGRSPEIKESPEAKLAHEEWQRLLQQHGQIEATINLLMGTTGETGQPIAAPVPSDLQGPINRALGQGGATPKRIFAVNPATGAVIVSDDGGKTWQPFQSQQQ